MWSSTYFITIFKISMWIWGYSAPPNQSKPLQVYIENHLKIDRRSFVDKNIHPRIVFSKLSTPKLKASPRSLFWQLYFACLSMQKLILSLFSKSVYGFGDTEPLRKSRNPFEFYIENHLKIDWSNYVQRNQRNLFSSSSFIHHSSSSWPLKQKHKAKTQHVQN